MREQRLYPQARGSGTPYAQEPANAAPSAAGFSTAQRCQPALTEDTAFRFMERPLLELKVCSTRRTSDALARQKRER